MAELLNNPVSVVRTRKVTVNRLLSRKEMVVEVSHPGRSSVPKTEVIEKLALKYTTTPDLVFCFGFRTEFGGCQSTGSGYVYDTLNDAKRFEPKHRQAKVIEGSYVIFILRANAVPDFPKLNSISSQRRPESETEMDRQQEQTT